MILTLTLVLAPRKTLAADPHKAVNLALGKRLAQLPHPAELQPARTCRARRRRPGRRLPLRDRKPRMTAEVALRFAAALDVPIQELLQTDTLPEIVPPAPSPAARCSTAPTDSEPPAPQAGRHSHHHRPLPPKRRQLATAARRSSSPSGSFKNRGADMLLMTAQHPQ